MIECFPDGKQLHKSDIKRLLLERADRMRTVMETYQSATPEAYDFSSDPTGLDLWLEKAKEVSAAYPLAVPKVKTVDDVVCVVEKIISSFKRFVESKGGWRGMYNDKNAALNERHARLFFYAIALREFQAIWKDEFGESIALDQAREAGSRLLELYRLLAKGGEPKQ